MSIESDIEFYKQLLPELLPEFEGKWVLIKDGELIEVYDTNEAAYTAGVQKFGAPPFLVREVRRTEPVETI